MKQISCVFVLIYGVGNFLIASPTTRYVHPDSALNSIQTALDSCADNDIVLVGPGIYEEFIIWPAIHGIDLVSEYGADTTIIDACGMERVIEITTGVDTTTLISGFTIRNGSVNGANGGGILCADSSSPKIIDNVIHDNKVFGIDAVGGGICCDNYCSPVIANNVLRNNSVIYGYGGGIACINFSSPVIRSNNVINNSSRLGGGIFCKHVSSPPIVDNSLEDNTAEFYGGGILCMIGCSPLIRKNILQRNTTYHGGVIGCRIFSAPLIDSNTITHNNGDGIRTIDGSQPIINFNNICRNSGYGMRNLDSTITVSAEHNWWGSASGPGGAGPGSGDSVNIYVDYDPWLTEETGTEEETHTQCSAVNIHVSAYPNPSISDFRFQISNCTLADNLFSIHIYDATGRKVRDLSPNCTNGSQSAVLNWDGYDNRSRKLPDGTYFATFEIDGSPVTKKLVLLK